MLILARAYRDRYGVAAINVVNDLCDYFDIWCFTIKHPKKAE